MYELWTALEQSKQYKWVELSHPLDNDSPYWAGIPDGSVELSKTVYDWGNPMLDCLIQTFKFPGQFGTHIDFPSHFDKEGVSSEAYGVELRTVPISKAVEQHFADIGQNMNDHDVTYENSQARERTQVLMDIANKIGGLVVGTGDLSELALGWATYNGDHMSMYAVNCSIPKTLVRHLTAFEAARSPEPLKSVLLDVLGTPVSPELLPPTKGEISQKTEDIVGPYELHDFFLYYAIRWAFPPRKVLRLAEHAFGRTYPRAVVLQWLRTFYRRFFAQQFKRSCLPDGPKVGSVSLSPRGDWRMPSDAVAALWLEELEGLE